MIGSDLLRFKKDQLYLLYDEETEGLNLARSRPWQLSYAICTIDAIESLTVRHLNWPNLQVSPRAAQITRFNMAQHLSLAEDPAIVLRDFLALRDDPRYEVVGHNILGFDNEVTETWRRLCGFPVPDWAYLPRCLDTNALFKAHQKQFAPDPAGRLAWQYRCLNWREKGLKSSLGFACKTFGIPYDERRAHSADYDTEINHAVLRELLFRLDL